MSTIQQKNINCELNYKLCTYKNDCNKVRKKSKLVFDRRELTKLIVIELKPK